MYVPSDSIFNPGRFCKSFGEAKRYAKQNGYYYFKWQGKVFGTAWEREMAS